MQRRSLFEFATESFETTISVRQWIPEDETLGGSRTAASGVPASYIIRRDRMLRVTLRFREDQWEDLLELIAHGQSGLPITWYPEADDPATSFEVYLVEPAAGTRFSPLIGDSMPRILEMPILIRSLSGSLWTPYFEAGADASGQDNGLGGSTAGGGSGLAGGGGLDYIMSSSFGVLADGITDDWARANEWVNWPNEHPTNPRRTLYLRPRVAATGLDGLGNRGQGVGMVISKPLVIPWRAGMRLMGDYQNVRSNYAPGSRIWPSFSHGFGVVLDDARRELDIVSGPFAGSRALRRADDWTGQKKQFFALRDASTLDLNGLAALTIEYWYQGSGADTGDGWQIASWGRWFNEDLTDSPSTVWDGCVRCNTNGGDLRGTLKTSDGDFDGALGVVASSPINDGDWHHVAYVYTGAYWRAFVDGVMIFERAATGTLLQDPAEELNFGVHFSRQRFQHELSDTPLGNYYGIRISRTARYAGTSFAPPAAAFAVDDDTLVLANFEEEVRCSSLMRTRTGDFWCHYRGQWEPVGSGEDSDYLFNGNGGDVQGIAVDGDINPGGSSRTAKTCGILDCRQGGYSRRWDTVTVERCRVGIEVDVRGNGYDSSYERVEVNNSWGDEQGRYCLTINAPNAGISSFKRVWLSGGVVPFYSGSAALEIAGLFIDCVGQIIRWGAIMRGDDGVPNITTVQSLLYQAEGGIGDNFKGCLALDGSDAGMRFVGAGCHFQMNIEDTFADAPSFIKLYGASHLTLDDPGFSDYGPGGHVSPDAMLDFGDEWEGSVVIRRHQREMPTGQPPWVADYGRNVVIEQPGRADVAYSATPEFDFERHSTLCITLTGNVTSSTAVNFGPGQRVRLRITQGGAGGYTFVWPANVVGADAIGATLGDVTVQEFEADEAGDLRAVAPAQIS